MAGSAVKYRHLSRKSSHRQALLRNLVTSLFTHESITTTWPKAKEAQRLAEKLITLGKRNTEASKRRALSIFYTPHQLLPKLFTTLRERYAARPGGYTRVLRIEPRANDQAPTALLQLVDGPKDMRFSITAQTLARQAALGQTRHTSLTDLNIAKVTRFRADGPQALSDEVARFRALHEAGVRVVDEGDVPEGEPLQNARALKGKIDRYHHTRRPDAWWNEARNKRLRGAKKRYEDPGEYTLFEEGDVRDPGY